ncbi:MAG: hypothetical protein E6Q44_01530 [Flavobacteriales bacterium]|nr:MAG: hypothetical protein E6Q44_01530 [Flavobacteriales bacterium]
MLRRLFSTAALSLFTALAMLAQTGSGSLKGKITDKGSKEPLPFVNVVVERGGTQVSGGATDFDGEYFIKPLDPGTYDVVVSYVGYQPYKQTGVVVSNGKITFLDIGLNQGVELKEFEVVQYVVPLIDRDGGASGGTVTRDQIAKMPGRTANSIATTVAGASDAGTGGGVSIRGSRTENTYYYIDGVKVPAGAGTGLPKSAIEEVQVITGGVPANFGDVTGGLINITTRGPSRNFFGGVDYLTSGYKVGSDITDIVGLDKYAFNQVEASLSGPILFKKDSVGNKTKPLIGFFLSGQYTNVVDGSPSYLGDLRVRPEVRERLLSNPAQLRSNGSNDVIMAYSSEYLRTSDVETLKTRQNAGEVSYLASGKIDITTTPTINLTVGGSIDYSNRQSFNRNNSLLNAENNIRIKENTWRGFVKFTQRFVNRTAEEEKRSTIQNAYYTLQLDYSRYQSQVEDFVHEDRFFDYGYVGKFQTLTAPQFELQADQPGQWTQVGAQDTLVVFTPGTQNPDLASINTFYFNALPRERFPQSMLIGIDDPSYTGYYRNLVETQNRGVLWNGQRPRTLYDLWNNIGFIDDPDGAEFRKRLNDQVRFSAFGSADIGDHAVAVGVEYEQYAQRRYDLSPVGLWGRGRNLANSHLVWVDTVAVGTVYLPGSTLPFVLSDRIGSGVQTTFDRNLRTALGLDPNGGDYIDVDAIDPGVFSLDMFSPDELIQSGNSIVNYVGYDHLGNKLTSKPSFADFFTGKDKDGNYTRLQAPFEPIYMSGYVMDKFTFDDIIFNVGVRVDRYDANQNVLKDKYLFQEAYTAGSAVPNSAIRAALANRPSNIGDDFVVYVDDVADPNRINGYRDGDTWYNAQGVELADGNAVAEAGQIRPYLVDGDKPAEINGSALRQNGFKDYTPAVNVMPRVAFSFPISDEAVFFAHYDVLTQRPGAGQSRLDLVTMSYLGLTGDVVTNPDLKPTKTIDYELGFQQVLSKASSLKIAAYYRELRDQIQIRNIVNAYPRTYRTYDNYDFGTVKGLTATFDLRQTGNVWMRASYTLQFADGTGSGPTTGISLINSGLPNLRTISPLDFDQRHRFQTTFDFRYGGGKDYNGPMLFGKPILSRTGVNVVSILGSGTPYSRSSIVYNEGAESGSRALEGSLNGSRLPWQFTTDIQLDRDIPLSFGGKEGEKAKSADLNIYLLVTNVFNTENIVGAYRFTGSPSNDGYLASAATQQIINGQTNPDSFRDLYALKVNNPYNFGSPRTIRLGVRFNF